MSDVFSLVRRYPWLPSLKEYYPKKALKGPIDFINEIFSPNNDNVIKERLLEFFEGAFSTIKEFSFYMDDEVNIDFYIVLKILLSVLDSKQIANRIAELYSRITNKNLNKDKYNLDYIYKDLGLDVPKSEKSQIYKRIIVKDLNTIFKTKYKIHYIDYLKLAIKLKDNRRRLVNNSLSNGYVFIRSKDLNRLMREYVRSKITTFVNLKDIKDSLFENHLFKDLVEKIEETWDKLKEEFEYSFKFEYSEGKVEKDDFPPCIQEIRAKIDEGQNLVHTERLFIVWFLIALKFPEEEIVNIFSLLPDFNREKTEYQVRYAIRKAYTPYSCKSLKSYNLCMAKKYKDDICLKGYYSKTQDKQMDLSRPLSYINIKKYRSNKTTNYSKNQSQFNNE
jgi:DNA primase large subunit